MPRFSHFLFLGNTNFSGFVQREHALAVALAKRSYRVTYIEGMPSIAAKVQRAIRSFASPYAIERGANNSAISPQLEVLTPPTVPTFSRSSITPSFDKSLFHRWFKKIEQRFDWSSTILFVSLPHWWTGFLERDSSSIPYIIYDKCDSLLVPSRTPETLELMEVAERRLMNDAKLITYSARAMEGDLRKITRPERLQFLPNAVSTEFIHWVEQNPPSEHRRKRVGFVGAVDERWVDVNLIFRLVRTLPDADFIFVGTVSREIKSHLGTQSNVSFTGGVQHAEVARLMTSFDAAIIPFLRNEITRVVNPLKLYEYCAAALPVVATETDELRHYAELVDLAGNEREFIGKVTLALGNNGVSTMDARKEFAKTNTWDQRVDSLLGIVQRDLRGVPPA